MRDFVQTDFWKYTDTPHSPDQIGGGPPGMLGPGGTCEMELGLGAPAPYVLLGTLQQAWLLLEQIRISGLLQICAKGVS